jgi:hypothetical protein
MSVYVRPFLWLLISACLYFAIAENVLRKGMPAPVSPRYTLYAIPAAVSMLRGYKHDYTAQVAVSEYFIRDPNGDSNDQIRRALDAKKLDEAGPWFVSGDDKGLIDLTYLSFVVFGPTTGSVVRTIVSLIGLSILLFFLQFKRDDTNMAALVAILCGMYVVLFTFGITSQAYTIAEPRFLGAISAISSLHLMMLVAAKRELAWHAGVFAIFQIALIMFAIHLRSSEIWQVLAIVVFAGSVAIVSFRFWRRALLITLMSIVGVLCLGVYKHVFYHPRYFTEEVPTRVLWHNALMGLAINPVLQTKYSIVPLDDVSITEAVRRGMIAEKRDAAAAILFPRENYSGGNFYEFNWAMYEAEAERMFLQHVLAEDPLEVLYTYAIIAPKLIWEDVVYLSSRSPEAHPPYLGNVAQIVTSPEVRREQDLYYSLFRPLPWIAALAAISTLLVSRSRANFTPLAALALLFTLSVVPAVLATSAIQYIQLSLLFGAALLYLLVILAGAQFIGGAFSRLKTLHVPH